MAEVGSAYVTLLPSAKGFGAKVEKQISGDVDKAGKSTGKRFGTGFGRTFGLVGGALGIGAIITQSSKLEQSFSKTMNLVAASTGAPKSAIAGLDKLAMKLGADTQFSANDAAGAMLELAKAGISTRDIMGGALKGTLLLAAAGGTDLGTASTIAANAMNTFNLRGKDMNKIASALAGGANASSASVESLGQALQQVGPGATNAGLSLQQTVGTLSAFDAAGIKGADAGTSLKTMLSRLVPQTDKASKAMKKFGLSFVDSKGNFDSITTVAQKLKDKLGPLSQAQRTQALTTIFGSDATRAATVLMKQGAGGLAKYIKATRDQGAAQKMADAAMKGTAGAMERLRGSVETAELALGKALAPTIEKTANFLSQKALPAVTKFIGGMQDGTGAGGRFADTLGNIASSGKTIVGFFTGLPGPIKKFGVELAIAAFAMGKLNGFVGPSISSLGTFVGSMRTAEFRAATFSQKMQSVGTGIRGLAGAGGMALIADSTTKAAGGFSTLESAAGGALTGASLGAFAGPPGAAIGAAIGGIGGLVLGLSRHTKEAGNSAKYAVDEYATLASTLDQVTGATTEATRQLVFQKLASSGALKTLGEYGITAREATNAIVQGGPAREKFISTLTRASQGLSDGTAAAKKYRDSLDPGTTDPKVLKAANDSYDAIKKTNDEKKRGIDLALNEVGATTKAVEKKRQEIAATRTLSAAISPKNFPRALVTDIKTNGLEPTRKAVVDLTRKYNLTPRQVATLIREQGGTPTKRMIDSIITSAKTLDRQHPNPKLSVRDTASSVIRSANHLLDIFNGRHSTATIEVQRRYTNNNGPGSAGQVRKKGAGGYATSGRTFIVGDRGPELFTSSQAGRITPNSRLGGALGGGGGSMAMTITNWDEGTGYIESVSDTRYYANGALESQ